MNRLLKTVASALGLCCAAGCGSEFREHHYFRTVNPEGETVNYFRVSVKGDTLLASSRYVSGYFDEEAVDRYFGEFAQPKNGAFPGSAATQPSAAADKTESLDKSLKGRKLVLLLSSNSDAIADEIGQMAQSREFTDSLVQLAGADRLRASRQTKNDVAIDTARGKALAAVGQQLTDSLDPNDAAKTRQALLQYVNALAADLGNETPFTDLAAAKQWLQFNRGRLLKEIK